MKIYVAAAAALPSASSRKPQTHEEKKRRWRCTTHCAADLSCLLAAPLCLPGPSQLLTLSVTCCQEAAPVQSTSFRIHLRLLFIVLLCSPPCRVETTDCRRNKGVSSAGRQWDAQPCQTERGIAQLLNRRESAKNNEIRSFSSPVLLPSCPQKDKTLQPYQSYKGRKKLSNS